MSQPPKSRSSRVEQLEPRLTLAAEIELIKDGYFDFVDDFTNVGGTLFFTAAAGNKGNELWKSDGTTSGTVMLKDIAPGAADSNPHFLTNVSGNLFFVARSVLWASDGTHIGTRFVSGVSGAVNLANLTNVGGKLFFTADDEVHGAELWVSDGTAAGTKLVKDIRTGSATSYPDDLTDVNGTLFFSARDATHGHELWRSDGTLAGTRLVKDINANPNSFSGDSSPSRLTNVNGKLFFGASDGGFTAGEGRSRGLYTSDGTAAGTRLIKRIGTGEAVNVGGTLFFRGEDGDHGDALWKSDGTAAGTILVKDTNQGADPFAPYMDVSYPRSLTNVGGQLYFVGYDAVHGAELWKSNGSAGGTLLVKDIKAGKRGAYPGPLEHARGQLFFTAENYLHGRELWSTNGTRWGTQLVEDMQPGPDSTEFIDMKVVGNRLFFSTGRQFQFGSKLWSVPLNQAPTLDVTPTPALSSIAEDDINSKGTFVVTLLGEAFADPDAAAQQGIAVTTAANFHGWWQFSLDGTKWSSLGEPSEASARLLPPSARLRFVPKVNFSGTVRLYYRAWDQTQGDVGGTFDVRGKAGGAHAFSTAYESASLIIRPINDRPSLQLSGSMGYTRGSPPVVLAPFAAVFDVDSANFAGGRLQVRIGLGSSTSNRLIIGAGFSVDANGNVKRDTIVIGRLVSSGFGTQALVVRFNQFATRGVVQQLVRAIAFKTVGGPVGTRTALLLITDGDGGVSDEATKTIHVA